MKLQDRIVRRKIGEFSLLDLVGLFEDSNQPKETKQ